MDQQPKLTARFYCTDAGSEPVRDWLNALDREDAKRIGEEIRLVQFGWPLGMPLVRKLEKDLWEVRISLPDRVARVLFTVLQGEAVLIHGFIKKDRKTPRMDLALSRKRLSQLRRAGMSCHES